MGIIHHVFVTVVLGHTICVQGLRRTIYLYFYFFILSPSFRVAHVKFMDVTDYPYVDEVAQFCRIYLLPSSSYIHMHELLNDIFLFLS